jgi:signal recognition particle subunit SEC65
VFEQIDKICKRGFYIDTKRSENENLKTYAARPSRMATSLTLKCSVSKPLLDNLEKALQKLNLETDESLSNMRENDVPLVSNEPPIDMANSTISFKVPQVVKDTKTKRAKNVVEKVSRKKEKCSKGKVTHYCMHRFITISCFVNSCKYISDSNIMLLSYMF